MNDMRRAIEQYATIERSMDDVASRRLPRSRSIYGLIGALVLLACAAAVYTASQIAPAYAQSVGGWNEGLSGSSAGAMNPSANDRRDSQVRTSGYRTWGERFNDWFGHMTRAQREHYKSLMERSDELDNRGNQRNDGNGGNGGVPGL